MRKSRFLAVLSAGIIAASTAAFAACGGGPDVPDGFTGTAISFYATYVNEYSADAYNELVSTYNSTQGVEDNVYVEMIPNSGSVGNLKSILTGASSRYDVIMVEDQQFKGLAMETNRSGESVFVNLEDYLTDDVKEAMDWEQIPESLLNCWRFNTEKSAEIGNKYLAGEGADLLAMPFNNSVHMLFYNTKIFSDMGINLVSVAEEECGVGEYEKLMAHGYAEYAESYGAPYEGAVLSKNCAAWRVPIRGMRAAATTVSCPSGGSALAGRWVATASGGILRPIRTISPSGIRTPTILRSTTSPSTGRSIRRARCSTMRT